MHTAAVDQHVAGLHLAQIHAGYGLSVNHHQELVAGEDVGQVLAGAVTFDDLVHGVDNGFEAREPLNAGDDGGLRDVEGIVAAEEGEADAVAHGRSDVARDGGNGEQRDEQAEHEAEDERGQRSGTLLDGGRLLGDGGGHIRSLSIYVTHAEAGRLVRSAGFF